jgi:CheY-like chemotaxis protein
MSKILWVEDDNEHFELYSYYLKKDYDINHSSTYEEAVEKINTNEYDLIIVDILLPSGQHLNDVEIIMNVQKVFFGIELLTKQLSKYKGKIIILTIVNEQEILSSIRAFDNNIPIITKYDTTPKEVDSFVRNFLGTLS